MGNSATKERGESPRNGGESSSHLGGYSSRSARSRHNLESSIFSLGGSSSNRETRERDREAERAAKEARRKQREEERERERERSRREESLDGRYPTPPSGPGLTPSQAVSW
jgi:hypothetical protein